MPNISDRELDKLFQEAGHEIRPEFDPQDWDDMAKRLDEAKRRGMFYRAGGYGLAVLLLISTAAWLTDSGTTTRRLAQNQPPSAQPAETNSTLQPFNTTTNETTTTLSEPNINPSSVPHASAAAATTAKADVAHDANTRTPATNETTAGKAGQQPLTAQASQREGGNHAATANTGNAIHGTQNKTGTVQKQQRAAGIATTNTQAATQQGKMQADDKNSAAQTSNTIAYAKADVVKPAASTNSSKGTISAGLAKGTTQANNTANEKHVKDAATAHNEKSETATTPIIGNIAAANAQRTTAPIKASGSERSGVVNTPAAIQQQNKEKHQANSTATTNTQQSENNNQGTTSGNVATTAGAVAATTPKQNAQVVAEQTESKSTVATQNNEGEILGQADNQRGHVIAVSTQPNNKAATGDTVNKPGTEANRGNAQQHNTSASDTVATISRNQTPVDAQYTHRQPDAIKNNGVLVARPNETTQAASDQVTDSEESSKLAEASASRNTANTTQRTDSVATPEQDSLKVVDTKAATDSTQDVLAEEKKKSKTPAKWFLRLPVSPDFSSINYGKPDKSGINAGLMAEFMPGKHWSVSLGAIWSKKIYTWDSPDKTYGGGPYGAGTKASFLNGDCRVIDIPLNITYYLRPEARTNYFITAGVSSYIMLKEMYTYTVWANQQEYQYNERYVHENKNWLSMLNLSIGIQHRLSNRFQVLAEPFLKAPLSGVGQGKVNLVSMGAFFTLKFQLNK